MHYSYCTDQQTGGTSHQCAESATVLWQLPFLTSSALSLLLLVLLLKSLLSLLLSLILLFNTVTQYFMCNACMEVWSYELWLHTVGERIRRSKHRFSRADGLNQVCGTGLSSSEKSAFRMLVTSNTKLLAEDLILAVSVLM